MSLPHVVILGGGPAGVGGAHQLRRLGRAEVTLFEQRDRFGGNAGSFDWKGHALDYGSHRLHPACDSAILSDIRELLGDELRDRPRHGRIRLRGRWIHFPLKPVDLALRLDPRFAAGAFRDAVAGPIRRRWGTGDEDDTFASVLEANLGPTICRDFYFPYARKIWGREPEELSPIQARRRVSAGSIRKLMGKVLSQVPGLKPPGAGRFYYPRGGYGRISEEYASAAEGLGADLNAGSRVVELRRHEADDGWTVVAQAAGDRREVTADHVWSTLPIALLARLVEPTAPERVLDAARAIRFRAMLLVYLELDTDRFTEFDAHYFPGADIAITRLSEPKNYALRAEPRGRTVLCAELPCSTGDRYWEMSDSELGELVSQDLIRSGLPLQRPPVDTLVKRLSHAYPIYEIGYEKPFGVLDAWASGLPRLLTYGRQGLFAHDNTHHALYMAYAAADSMRAGGFDEEAWQRYRTVFETHVVED